MMNVKRFSLLIIMSAVFLANIYLLSVYTDGDLYFYRKFYESLYRESWLEITTIQQMATGSAEPIYGQVAWVGSNLNIDHDVLISLFNTLLLFLIHRVLSHYRASVAFRVLVFSNYYILVLLTGAERLKFGFVLALLSCLIERDLLKKIVAFLMPLAHSQMSAHLLAIVVSRVSIPSGVGKISIKSFLRGVAMLVIVVAVAGLIYVKVGDVIVGKIGYYSEVSNKYESMVKILGIALVGFFAFKIKRNFLFLRWF